MSQVVTISLSAGAYGNGLATTTYTPPQSPLVNNGAPEGIPSAVALSAGANAIPVPAGSLRALIVPPMVPNPSTNVKQAKTVSADTGVTFTSDVVLLPLAAGVTTLYITSTSDETVSLVWG